jgi:hypothetical protein
MILITRFIGFSLLEEMRYGITKSSNITFYWRRFTSTSVLANGQPMPIRRESARMRAIISGKNNFRHSRNFPDGQKVKSLKGPIGP